MKEKRMTNTQQRVSFSQFYCACAYMLLCLFVTPVWSIQPVRNIPLKSYVKQGDINLGAFLSISNYSPFELCGELQRFPLVQQYVEALMYAVDEINSDPDLLPNTTLGMIILDDCVKQSTASAQAVRFLPHHHMSRHHHQHQEMTPDARGNSSDTEGAVDRHRGSDGRNVTHACRCDGYSAHYDVVGVLSPTRSENSVAVSYLLSPVQLPQVSFAATSDELSDSHLHPYFLRLIPPASIEVTAILEFVARQGWSYISIVTSRGSYGEAAASTLRRKALQVGVCVAVHVKAHLGMTPPEYRDLVRKLLAVPSARAVIGFIDSVEIVGVLKAVQELGVVGWHMWIGSDAWVDHLTIIPPEYREAVHGSFITNLQLPDSHRFEQYFRNVKPSSSSNPWFGQFWERQFSCSFQNGTCDESLDVTESRDFHFLSLTGLAIDSVFAYAHALTQLMGADCPGVFGVDLRSCVSGDRLLAFLGNVSFEGITGSVKMSETRANYVISQVLPGQPFTLVPVAMVDVGVHNNNITTSRKSSNNDSNSSGDADVDLEDIFWGRWFTHNLPKEIPTEDVFESSLEINSDTVSYGRELFRIRPQKILKEFKVKHIESHSQSAVGYRPESTCISECQPNEIRIPEKIPCCWSCHPCRSNEIVLENGTKCKECPVFEWPDETLAFRNCSPIPPDYPSFNDVSVIFEVATSCLGMAVSLAVCIAFVYLRESKVVKASGRELSSIQLVAIVAGYATMLVYASPPSDLSCSVAYFLFCLTLDLLYAALLVKAVRIYRIFHAAAKGKRGLRMTSPVSQVILVCCIVLGQTVISTCVTGLHKASATLSQPSRSERYVELSCDMTLPAVSTFLAYNLALVILCAVLAFKTRRLPDNYNESRFISMCVTTTLVIWLAFIPTFLTSSRASLKTLLLSLALLLNHSVALVFLFLSKLYAAIFREDSVMVLPVVAESGQVVGMLEGITNSRRGVTGVKGRSEVKAGATKVGESGRQASSLSATTDESVRAAAHVQTIFSGSLGSDNAKCPPAPRVRKTGRFTVVTHSGNFTQDACNRTS